MTKTIRLRAAWCVDNEGGFNVVGWRTGRGETDEDQIRENADDYSDGFGGIRNRGWVEFDVELPPPVPRVAEDADNITVTEERT